MSSLNKIWPFRRKCGRIIHTGTVIGFPSDPASWRIIVGFSDKGHPRFLYYWQCAFACPEGLAVICELENLDKFEVIHL